MQSTSTKEPDIILDEIKRVLLANAVTYRTSEPFCLLCTYGNVQFEMEVGCVYVQCVSCVTLYFCKGLQASSAFGERCEAQAHCRRVTRLQKHLRQDCQRTQPVIEPFCDAIVGTYVL